MSTLCFYKVEVKENMVEICAQVNVCKTAFCAE